jgi:hypothetical protein
MVYSAYDSTSPPLGHAMHLVRCFATWQDTPPIFCLVCLNQWRFMAGCTLLVLWCWLLLMQQVVGPS